MVTVNDDCIRRLRARHRGTGGEEVSAFQECPKGFCAGPDRCFCNAHIAITQLRADLAAMTLDRDKLQKIITDVDLVCNGNRKGDISMWNRVMNDVACAALASEDGR
jgi:hypothetical protein